MAQSEGRPAVGASSRIEHVTVYSRGARIRRVAAVSIPDSVEPTLVRFTGLPLALVEDSVRAEIAGAAVASTIRVALDVPSEGVVAAEEPIEVVAARRRVTLANAELARLTDAAAMIAGRATVVADPSDDPPAKWAEVVAARFALAELRAEQDIE